MTDAPSQLAQAIADAQRLHTETHRGSERAHRFDERMGTLEHLEAEAVESIKATLLPLLDQLELDDANRHILHQALHPKEPAALALLVPVLAALGYFLAQAAGAGPSSSLAMSSMRQWGSYTIDPNALADAANRGRLDGAHAFDRAQDSGVSPDKFVDLVNMARRGPSEGTILEAWRRDGTIAGQANRLLKETGLTDEGVALVERLRLQPMDAAIATAAVTQNQIQMPEFEYLLEANGIDPAYAKKIYESAGATMPPDMAMRLFREGWIDEPKFEEILTESTLKNKYVPMMKDLRYRYPPMEQTLRMLRHKIIEAPEAMKYLDKLGFFPDDARRLVDSAASSTTQANKHLTPSTIERLYEVGRFSKADATTQLIALGYDATEADLLLFLADEMKAHSQMERAATSIGTRYVSWKIDRAEAGTLLDRINYPGGQRDELLEIWDARREAQTLHLSEAFLHKAFKLGSINRADVERRLLAMGYDAVDTDIIMRTDFAEVAPKPKSKDLTRADEVKRYSTGIITRPVLHDRLTTMGYDATEADQIIELADEKAAAAAAKETASNGA